MPYVESPPKRVRALILGGGIHGVGVLHDLVSRGFKDVFLCEKNGLGSGTSSRSTKLIHGGLRYLKRISDFPLVSEALRERRLLLSLAPDIVHPLELYLPLLEHGGEKSWMVRAGLTLYDVLAGKQGIQRHRKLLPSQALLKAPVLDESKFPVVYSFWDAQTDDMALVHRVAASAVAHGGRINEACEVLSVQPGDDGWIAEVRQPDGQIKSVSALYVINTLGPWSNLFLEKNGLEPMLKGINNKGVHCVFPDIGLRVGLFLQSPDDGRIFFLLPWNGKTLLGTTEEEFTGNPDHLQVTPEDVKYLLNRCNPYLKTPLTEDQMICAFAGLRWLAVEKNKGISGLSRDHRLSEHSSGRGLLLTLYGGKLTCYRSLSEAIGDRVTNHFGEFRPSRTKEAGFWIRPEDQGKFHEVPDLDKRFA